MMIMIELNSYLFQYEVKSPKANYKVRTSKEKKTKHARTKYKKDIHIIIQFFIY
jgi:hypothetical protein